MSGSQRNPPEKIKVQFKSPTVADLDALSGHGERRTSVKDMVGKWEINSMASNSDAGSIKSYRSLRSDTRSAQSTSSFAKRFDRRELFNLVLHIPMPDGDIEDYEVAVNTEYDPTVISKAICHKHSLNFDIMGTRIENQINRLVAETALSHTESFNAELDKTREIAIEAHGKQKQDNVELKKRLLKAKKIIESYDRRLKQIKSKHTTSPGSTGAVTAVPMSNHEKPEAHSTQPPPSTQPMQPTHLTVNERSAELHVEQRMKATIEKYENQVTQIKIDSETEAKAMVEMAALKLTQLHLQEIKELKAAQQVLVASNSDEEVQKMVEKARSEERAAAEQRVLQIKEMNANVLREHTAQAVAAAEMEHAKFAQYVARGKEESAQHERDKESAQKEMTEMLDLLQSEHTEQRNASEESHQQALETKIKQMTNLAREMVEVKEKMAKSLTQQRENMEKDNKESMQQMKKQMEKELSTQRIEMAKEVQAAAKKLQEESKAIDASLVNDFEQTTQIKLELTKKEVLKARLVIERLEAELEHSAITSIDSPMKLVDNSNSNGAPDVSATSTPVATFTTTADTTTTIAGTTSPSSSSTTSTTTTTTTTITDHTDDTDETHTNEDKEEKEET
jgi:hypothetical protein